MSTLINQTDGSWGPGKPVLGSQGRGPRSPGSVPRYRVTAPGIPRPVLWFPRTAPGSPGPAPQPPEAAPASSGPVPRYPGPVPGSSGSVLETWGPAPRSPGPDAGSRQPAPCFPGPVPRYPGPVPPQGPQVRSLDLGIGPGKPITRVPTPGANLVPAKVPRTHAAGFWFQVRSTFVPS
jgi:hypothetical protein